MENALLIVFLPSLYIFGAVLALLQFQVVFTLAIQGVAKLKTISYLSFAAPAAQALTDYLVKVFGQPHKFVPQPTHVLLVALLMAVILHVGRK